MNYTCKHCHQPIHRCTIEKGKCGGTGGLISKQPCTGWKHTAKDGSTEDHLTWHNCGFAAAGRLTLTDAEPLVRLMFCKHCHKKIVECEAGNSCLFEGYRHENEHKTHSCDIEDSNNQNEAAPIEESIMSVSWKYNNNSGWKCDCGLTFKPTEKVNAIKHYRETQLMPDGQRVGLKEAKDALEEIQLMSQPLAYSTPEPAPEPEPKWKVQYRQTKRVSNSYGYEESVIVRNEVTIGNKDHINSWLSATNFYMNAVEDWEIDDWAYRSFGPTQVGLVVYSKRDGETSYTTEYLIERYW